MQINEDTLRAEVSVALPMSAPKLLFVEMVERLLRQTMVKQVPGGHQNAFVPNRFTISRVHIG